MLCDCVVYLQAWDDAALNITVNPLEVRSNQNTSSLTLPRHCTVVHSGVVGSPTLSIFYLVFFFQIRQPILILYVFFLAATKISSNSEL